MKRQLKAALQRRRQRKLRSQRRPSVLVSLRRNLLLEACEPRLVLAGVPQLVDLNPTGGSDPSDFVQVGDLTFFAADDGVHGRELWKTDGTLAGTSAVMDLRPGSDSSEPTDLVAFNGLLYFTADDGLTGRELWQSDGSAAGTVLVRDINPGQGYQYPVGEGNLNSFAKNTVVAGGRLMFAAEEVNTGAELWSSDGTASGTALVKDIATGSTTSYYGDYPNSSSPQELVEVNGVLFFSADDGVNGRELWKSDGTADGTVMVKDIYSGSSPYYYYGYNYGDFPNAAKPSQLTAVNGQLFFAATDGTNGTELWKSDGTAAGTVLVKDIQPGSGDSLYGDNSLTEFQGRLLFAAETDEAGKELWISDGTETGTALVKDIRPGSVASITSGYLTELNGQVYFAADDGTGGTELWKTDGNEAGTVLVSNVDGSASGSFPRYLTAANGRLYFSAFTADSGRELWESDGTGAGTTRVADLLSGTGSSSPRELFAAGQTLLFSADNTTDGRELYLARAGDDLLEASLTIYVDSQAVSIPANVGVSTSGTPLSQVRSLGSDGTLIVAPIDGEPLQSVTIGDFFDTWRTNAGQPGNNPDATFDNDELMNNPADTTDTVQMFVNGQVSTAFDNYVIQDGDEIVLVYGANPIVSLNTNFGPIVLELFAAATPGTVDNFLNYVNRGDYLNTFIHRSDPLFVIQGGGFATTSSTFTSTDQFSAIPTDPPIQNEPGISNLRGTVAMAKLGGDPNSATSQFFVNLDDDNTFLDLPQNNSFTVFAQVLDMTTVDTITTIPVDKTHASPFNELPVTNDNQLVVIEDIAGQGRVSGVKFVDLNADGILDNGETLLAGVTVFVDANVNGEFDAGETSTTTDSNGRFLLELMPGTYVVDSVVADGRYATLPSGAVGYEVTVTIGREVEDLNFGESDLTAPGAIDLLPAFDTGSLDTDNLTRLNNATAAAALQFQISAVLDGATVRIFSDGNLLGSATAAGGTATVTTDGSSLLTDGLHSITATQELQGSESAASAALSVTIDTAPPAEPATAAPDQAQAGVLYTFDADSPDEGQVTYALSNAPAGMTLDAQSGVLSWTPTPEQVVPQQFVIQVVDSAGNVSDQPVNVTVLGEVPAYPESYQGIEDTVLTIAASNGVLANDGDSGSGPLTASLITNAAHGSVTLTADGSFSYTPDANFSGQDTFTYQATDGDKLSNVAIVTLQVQAVNDPPVGAEDSYTLAEDTPLVVDAANGVLKNDTDVDSDTLTASLANQPTHGTLTLNADGSFTYTPNQNFFGTDTFAYRVSDGTLETDPVAVSLTVTPVNDAPTAADDNYTVNEDTVLIVSAAEGVLANDIDPDGNVTATQTQAPSHGTLTLNADGSFTYTPDANFAGSDSFTYSANDGVNQSSAEVTITVANQPDAPTANDDSFNVADDGTSHSLDVLANDTFSPDINDNLTVISVTQGNQGGVVSLIGGQVSYQPQTGFTGTETFQYTIEDADQLTSTATVTVTVTEGFGNRLSGFVYMDGNADGQRDAGELGVPGVLITLTGTTSAGDAISRTMITNNDGLYLFEALSAGTYQLSERQPTAMVDGGESSSAAEADLTTNDLIANLVVSGGQTFGENNFAESNLRPGYISIAWFFASSTPTSEIFRETIAMAEESIGESELAQSIRDGSVVPPDAADRAPIASVDSYSTKQGTSLNIAAASGVLANDVDPDGDTITAVLVSNVAHGTLTLSENGSFDYTPVADFVGTDRFTYQTSDGTLTSSTVEVTIAVEAVANTFALNENSPTGTVVGRVQLGSGQTLSYAIDNPTLDTDLLLRPDDHLSGDPASAMVLIEYLDLQCPNCKAIHPVVLALEDDFDGELLVVRRHLPLTAVHPNAFQAAVASEAAARQGMFEEMADLMFENQDAWADATDPQPFFEDYADTLGLDLTQFRQDLTDPALTARVQRDADAADRLGAAATPTFYLNGGLVDSTDATDDFQAVIEDALQNFDDVFLVNRDTGDLVVADGNQLNFEVTPTYTLTVVGTDTNGNTTPTTVTINLTNVNEAAPVAFTDTYTVAQDRTLTVDAATGVLKNDTDDDGDTLTALVVTNPTSGSLTLNSNGSFVYVPNTGFSGTDSFAYQASDGSRTSSIATVTLNVTANNTAPAPSNDVYYATQDTTLTINTATGVLANDDDVDNDPLTATLIQTVAHGQLTLNNDGSFSYAPSAGFSGVDTFTYRASDGEISSSVATVTINVAAANTPPVAVDDSYSVDENIALTVPSATGVLANDQDNNLGSLTAQLVTGPIHGSLSLTANGSFTYTPADNYSGTDTFTYRANDGSANSNTATVTITITAINQLPQAIDDNYAVTQGNQLTVAADAGVLSNDVDLDDDSLTASIVAATSNGTLTLMSNGAFDYLPNLGFTGTDSFSYQAHDASGDSNTATVTIRVNAANTFSLLENTSAGTLVGQLQLVDPSINGDVIFQFDDPQLAPALRLVPDDHIAGSPTSSVVLIQYVDFQSPTDQVYHPIVNQLKNDFVGQLLVVRRHLPLSDVHANAFAAAVAAEAAGRQSKFEQFSGLLFAHQDDWDAAEDVQSLFTDYATQLNLNVTQFTSDLSDSALAARVQRDIDAADALGVTATPGYFLDGALLSELPASHNEFKNLIQTEVDQVDEVFRLNRLNGQLLVRDSAALDYETTPTFEFQVRTTDLEGDTDLLDVVVNLIDLGETPPQSNPDTYTVNEDTPLTISGALGILGNDTDSDGDSLFARLETSVTHGTLQLLATGAFTYTPSANFHGTDTFVYQAFDGRSLSELTQVTLNVTPVNDLPQATDDSYSVSQESMLDINAVNGILANDQDIDGDPLTAVLVDNPTHGTLSLNSDGSFTYTPTATFSGTDTFTYKANDGTADAATSATVNITITEVNQPPTAQNDSFTTPMNAELEVASDRGLLVNDSDLDDDPLIAQLVTQPNHGTLILAADGTFQYTPDNGYSGTDTFTYQANDGLDDSSTATVTITVTPPNTFVLPEASRAGTVVGQVQAQSNAIDGVVVYELVQQEVDSRLDLVTDDHLSGDPAAAVLLIEYLDYQCPSCQTFHPIVQQLEDDFAGDLLVVRRHFPLTSVHQNAFAAAVAAEAAGRQDAFDTMGDLLFTQQADWNTVADPQTFFEDYATQLGLDLTQFRNDLNDTALTDRVQRDLDNALALGANATPTFYLQGTKLTQLPNSLAQFSTQIQSALDQVDDAFALDRTTGELTVLDPLGLDFETTPTLNVDVRITDSDGDIEVVTVTVNLTNISDQAQGAVLSAGLIDDIMAGDESWLLPSL